MGGGRISIVSFFLRGRLLLSFREHLASPISGFLTDLLYRACYSVPISIYTALNQEGCEAKSTSQNLFPFWLFSGIL
jgi:hypothetical protein